MSNGYFMPKNVFKGADSNGNSYRFEEWDFSTLATMEGLGFVVTLILVLAFASIAGPLILLFLLLFCGTSIRFTYLITALISAYILYDFANGWLCLIATSFFLSDKQLGYVMSANIITLLISLVFVMFGNLLNKFVFEPVSHLTEDEYNRLKPAKQKEFVNKVEHKKVYVIILIFVLSYVGFFTGALIDKHNKGWVQRNIEKVDGTTKE